MRRLLGVLLPILLMIQMYSSVFAFAADIRHNSPLENQSILDRLQDLYGNGFTESDVLNELHNLGLLDEDGQLKISDTIMVNNTPMTLNQVRIMLQSQGVDLQQRVSVDGASITLGELKVMLEIEKELSRIRETYLTGVPFTEAHLQSYSTLVDQLTEEGIEINQNQVGIMNDTGPSINHDARIKVRASDVTFTAGTTNLNLPLKLEFSLVDRNGNPIVGGLGYDVSFDWHVLDGSAKRNESYLVQSGGTNAVGEGTVTIPRGKSSVEADVTVRFLKDLRLNEYMRWSGDKVFYIQASNPVNILFEHEKRVVNIPITLRNNYTWVQSVEHQITDTGWIFGYIARDNPTIPMGIYGAAALDIAVRDIFGGIEHASILFQSSLRLVEAPFFAGGTYTNRTYAMTAYPMLVDASGVEIKKARYNDRLEGEYKEFGKQQRNLTVHSVNEENKTGSNHYVKFSGAWPGGYVLTDPQYSPTYYNSAIDPIDTTYQFDIIDAVKPRVSAITAPYGEYYPGMVIPISVEFSEPVRVGSGMKLDLPGVGSLAPVEADGTLSKYATYLYTVPANPNRQLILDSIANITDMANNVTPTWTFNDDSNTLPNVSMTTDPLTAFTGFTLDNEPSGGVYANDSTIEVKLSLDEQNSVWLRQAEHYDNNTKQLKTVYVKAGGMTYPLMAGGEGPDEGSFFTASIPAVNYEPAGGSISIELYTGGEYIGAEQDEYGNVFPAYFHGGSSVVGVYATARIKPVSLVESIQLDDSAYPNNGVILTLGDTVTLGANITPEDATYPKIKWSSNNSNVAQIDPDTGEIRPISEGTVSFTATAANKGYSNPVTATTPDFTVRSSGPSTIAFQKGKDTFHVTQAEAVSIFWSQNLIGRIDGKSVDFDVAVYEGNYDSVEVVTGAPLHVGTSSNSSQYDIPKGILQNISVDGKPAYTIKVSAHDPDNEAVILSALGYITVYSRPVKVNFQKLSSYNLTDEASTQNIAWTITDFAKGDKELKVYKNNTIIHQSSPVSTHYTLSIDDVAANALRDVYTVTLRAKNDTDSSWSADSLTMYVYNRNALDIVVNGQIESAVAMDNNNEIKTLYETKGSQGILDLSRDINLARMISIHYGAYAWGNLTDQIQWASSDSRIASVNYRQGTLYENIERFNYSSYSPSTEFMLSGHSNGTSQIKAIHLATMMETTLDAHVTTLKDRLYLFQFLPKKSTNLTYTNGLGQTRSLTTNGQGEIAIYEESGIASDISLRSGNGADLHLGTLYKDRLVSSEGDARLQELYPVNAFKLRPAAKVELYVKKPDGTPYTGQVTYRGAVYKNGKIALASMEKDGVTVKLDSKGHFTLNLDPTQFWVNSYDEELGGFDRLEFLYEVLFDEDYYPQLIRVNGNITAEDVARFGESVVSLRSVEHANRNKPFIVSQVLDYQLVSGRKLAIMNYNGSIGPSDLYLEPGMVTDIAWWGQAKSDGYDVRIRDEHGHSLAGQKVQTITYPFATMAYTHNVTTLSEDVLELGIGERKKAGVALYGPDTTLLRNLESAFTFTNMVGAPSAADPSKGVGGAMRDLNDTGNPSFDPSSINTGDTIMGMALGLMNGKPVGAQNMNLLVTATEDPLVYRGLITMVKAFGNGGDTEIAVGGIDDEELNVLPGTGDIQDLVKKGTKGVVDELKENAKKPVNGGLDYGVDAKGYFEVEARYNTASGKWNMSVIGGGFDLNGVLGYAMTLNAMVGPVPITGEFKAGAQLNLSFRVYKPAGEMPEGIQVLAAQDYFTALRVNLYVKAFGGLGFDYSVVALKIGVFGQIDLTYAAEFLNRPYLSSPNNRIHAMNTTISGQAGIKFVAKALFITYEKVLASRSFSKDLWKTGDPAAIEAWKQQLGSSSLSVDNQAMSMMSFMSQEAMGEYRTVSEEVSLEKRDYLDRYDRQWMSAPGRRMALSADTGIAGAPEITDILTNAYPYANPLITRDGSLLAYMSDGDSTDVNETRASWAVRSGSGFADQGALPMLSSDAHADNNLALDGTADFAVAAWEQQSMKLPDNGEALDWTDMVAMMNHSEILASVYDGTDWRTIQLTDNAVPDLSPVVAARGGQAFAAWRSLAGVNYNGDEIQYGDASDTIVYKTYNKQNQTWSATQTLYNGSHGKVKGIQAAMLSDGTTAVVYTVDTGALDNNSAYSYEVFAAVVDGDGHVVSNLRLTNNDDIDQNPQIAAVNFGAQGEKFVLGWHHINGDGIADIELAVMNGDGTLYENFIHSLTSMGQHSSVFVNDTFRFVKGENLQLDTLSVIWAEPSLVYSTTVQNNVDRDVLRAVRFIQDEQGRVVLTAPLEVAVMDDYTVIDHFDAYAAGENTIQAVLLASAYTGAVQFQDDVFTVDAISSMKSVFATYRNEIEIPNIQVNYGEIKYDFRTPFQYTVVNMGVDPIDSVQITLQPDGIVKVFDNLNLTPNQAAILRVDYDVPDAASGIHDLQYVLEAVFRNGNTVKKSGSLNLDVPDLGVAKLEMLSDGQAERHFMAILNNLGDVPLAGDNKRKVFAGIYTSPTYSADSELEVREIAGDDLQLLDEDALTMQFTYQVPQTGIPAGGIRLYTRVWAEERQQDGSYAEVAEYYEGNNARSILFPNNVEANNGDPILIKIDQEGGPTGTTALITVRNLFMSPVTGGNVLLQLLDADDRVIETKLLASAGQELLELDGEEEAVRSVTFLHQGDRVIAQYFTSDPQQLTAGISAITLDGIPMSFDAEKTEYSLSSVDRTETIITAAAQSIGGIVEIRDGGNGEVLASGRGVVSYVAQLHDGAPPTRIQVVAIDENTQTDAAVYTISILNTRSSNGGNIPGSSNSGEAGDPLYTVREAGDKTVLTIIVPLAEGSSADAHVKAEAWKAVLAKVKQAEAAGRKAIVEVKTALPLGATLPVEGILIGFPREGIFFLATETSAELIVNTDLAKVAFDTEAVDALGEGSKGGELELQMQMHKADASVLSSSAKQKIGDRPIVDIAIRSGQRELTDLGGGKAAIRIPYTAGKVEKGFAIVAYTVDHDGEIHVLPGTYQAAAGSLSMTTNHFSRFAVGYNEKIFADVAEQAWYYEAIGFLAAREMVKGIGNERFAPLANISRADFLIMVMNAYGIELDQVIEDNFADAGHRYYTKYLGTAKRLGLVQGIGNNRYAPELEVNRQDMAVILYRILARLEEFPAYYAGDRTLADFEDRSQIASYAVEAIGQFVASGILSGDGKHIMPQGRATRAEAAQMLYNLLNISED